MLSYNSYNLQINSGVFMLDKNLGKASVARKSSRRRDRCCQVDVKDRARSFLLEIAAPCNHGVFSTCISLVSSGIYQHSKIRMFLRLWKFMTGMIVARPLAHVG
jgi:hypothetical protein